MSLTSVGIYEFNAKDLIGHGAFAVVYKGRLKSVSEPFLLFYYVPVRVPLLFMENVLCETKSGIDKSSEFSPVFCAESLVGASVTHLSWCPCCL